MRLKTGAGKLKDMVNITRAEFFALPVCSFDQPIFAYSPYRLG